MERIQRLNQPREISPHLYIVSAEDPHQWNANVYLIKGEEPTLVDCGSTEGTEILKNNLRELDLDFKKIKNVIATHGHRDHVYAIHQIRKENPYVTFYIHEGDREAITTGNKELTATTLYEKEQTLPFEPIRVKKEHILRDKQTLQMGEHDIFVEHTPGHTPGSVCFRGKIDDEHVLFAGDTVYGHANTSGANFDDWENSLRKLKEMEYNVIFNGHNHVQYLPITKSHFLTQIPKFQRKFNPWS